MLLDKHATNPDIKVIDFGMAHRFIQGEEYKSLGGTPQYIGESTIQVWFLRKSTIDTVCKTELKKLKCVVSV